MTVRLLMDYLGQPANTLITRSVDEEEDMIAAKMASADLTGGTVYIPPEEQAQYVEVYATTNPDGSTSLVGAGWVIKQFVRGSPIRIATFGDSTANLGTTQGASEMAATTFSAPFPASGTTILKMDIDKWACGQTYPLAWPVINCGVGSETTTQMLARDAAAAGATRKALTDLANANPDVVILRAGSINDLLALTAASSQSLVDAVYNRHIEILQKALSSGAIVIDEGFFGYSPASGTQADLDFRRAAIVSLNARYAAYAGTLSGRVHFLDVVGTLTQADGNYIAGVYESTGVHLNEYGGLLLGELEAAVLRKIYGASSSIRFAGTNVITNALMRNTGAQAYGTVATGFTIGTSGAGSVRQNAKIEAINDKIFQTCEYVWSTTAQYGSIYMPFDPTTMGIVANDVYGFEFDYYIENMSGAVVPAASSGNQTANVELVKSANGTVAVQMLATGYATTARVANIVTGHVCAPITIREASAALASGVFYFKWGSDTAGTYKLGVANPRIVKLGVARVTE